MRALTHANTMKTITMSLEKNKSRTRKQTQAEKMKIEQRLCLLLYPCLKCVYIVFCLSILEDVISFKLLFSVTIPTYRVNRYAMYAMYCNVPCVVPCIYLALYLALYLAYCTLHTLHCIVPMYLVPCTCTFYCNVCNVDKIVFIMRRHHYCSIIPSLAYLLTFVVKCVLMTQLINSITVN